MSLPFYTEQRIKLVKGPIPTLYHSNPSSCTIYFSRLLVAGEAVGFTTCLERTGWDKMEHMLEAALKQQGNAWFSPCPKGVTHRGENKGFLDCS